MPVGVSIENTVPELGSYVRSARRNWAKVPRLTAEEMAEFLEERLSRATGKRSKKGGRDTGALSASWQVGIEGTEADSAVVGEVMSTVPYARNVDVGRAPGGPLPDIRALERWGERRLGKPGLGFALAVSIARKGIRKRRFRRSALRGLKKRQAAIANKAMQDVIDRAERGS